ncbi:Ras-related protein RIC1 [Elysia marginata]|uniref:Ras-related protein RIC1 n=1 Tax=Elysia marginata TaxID=1093978 RepID=A0AAV4G390_9GAST|nr:Ras-related protein RIC1 [Elysia marginata]
MLFAEVLLKRVVSFTFSIILHLGYSTLFDVDKRTSCLETPQIMMASAAAAVVRRVDALTIVLDSPRTTRLVIVRNSTQPPHRPTPPLIPPNFLLSPSSPSSSIASPLFPSQFLPPPPHLIANPFTPPHPPPPLPPPPSSSLPHTTSHFDEMARRKKSPKSIAPWRLRLPDSNHHEDSNSNSSTSCSSSKLARCQICPVLPADGSSPPPLPIEGHEYFIDSDGTLTIKNGVCPRNLALMLFTHVFANQGRYEALLGENLVKFLLNLKQIVEKHQFMCPSESPLQWANAQNVLKQYAHGASLKLFPSTLSLNNFGGIHNQRKRPHQDDAVLMTSNSGQRHSDFHMGETHDGAGESKLRAGQTKDIRDKNEDRSRMPDNFLVEPLPTPSPSPSHSPSPVQKTSQAPRKEKKSPDSGLSLTPSGSERDQREGASDCGSIGGASSRVTSPAPSVSSVASSLSLAEAAKQMANTKRGSKILPIASGDGGTRYLCPVCALELPNDHELTVHIRSHNSQSLRGQVTTPNTCTICGKTLSSQSSLDRHMLVHSGERPFRCKICDMSFTTNGNMHRHARIHEKNGSNIPKPPGRKPSASSSSNAQPSSSSSSSSKASRGKKESGQSHAEAFHRETTPAASSSGIPPLMAEFGSDKLDLFKAQQDPAALLQYYNDMSLRMMFPFGSHHPAFPYQHMMAESTRLPYLSPILNPFTGEVLAKRPRLSSPASTHAMMAAAANAAPLTHLAREMAREPSPDLRTQQSVTCRLCPKTFSSQWSLDSHMESHVIVDEQMEEENGCAKCKTCKTVAKSEESLLLHTLTHHPSHKDLTAPDSQTKSPSPKSAVCDNVSSPSPPSKPVSTASPTNSNKGSNGSSTSSTSNSTKPDNISNNNQGFQNLNFASFTSKKFPLIAKAFCEEECGGAARALKLPVYPCSQCDLEFPVEGARDLHEVCHLPEEYTVCPICKCHFSSSSQLQLHMLKHVSDLHFEQSRDSENLHGDTMSKTHFLAQFGLVTKDIGVLPSMLEEFSGFEQEQENTFDGSKNGKASGPDVKPKTIQMTKQELEVTKKEDIEDELSECLRAEREAENKEELYQLQSHPHSSKTTEKGKTLTSSSLKISSSLFGGKPALKAFSSRSPSPLSMSGSDLGPESLEDSSLPAMFTGKHSGVPVSSLQAPKHHQKTQYEAAQFQCQVCSYTSTDKSTLLRHMRTHSGERPYKCAVCDYSFTTKANCERHLRQKHGLERDQMAGKIKCNQYIISSSSLSASTLIDDDNIKTPPPLSSSSSPSPSTRSDASHVDLSNLKGLKQHINVSPSSRIGYLCRKCKVTFSSRKALISHMSSHHPSVPPQDYNRFTASLEKAVDGTMDGAIEGTRSEGPTPVLMTPPPAHAHTKQRTPSTASLPTNQYESPQKQLLKNLPANLLALLPKGLLESSSFDSHTDHASAVDCSPSVPFDSMKGFIGSVQDNNDDQPLDFSSTGRNKHNSDLLESISASDQKKQKNKKVFASHSEGICDDDNEAAIPSLEADGPIDLSISSMPKQLRPQPPFSSDIKAVNLAQAQAISSKQTGQTPGFSSFGVKVEDKYLPLTLSANYGTSSTSEHTSPVSLTRTTPRKTPSQFSPFKHSLLKPDEVDHVQAHPQGFGQKHPAFPQFISMMTSPVGQTMLLQGIPVGAAPPGLNLKAQESSSSSSETALSLKEKMAAFLPSNLTLHPTAFSAGIQGASKSGPSQETSKSKASIKTQEPIPAKVCSRLSFRNQTSYLYKGSHGEHRQTKLAREQRKGLDWTQHQRNTGTGKGSSSESDSSCDLASVNKILDATDAQRFQGFLNVANEDDEQDYRSESIESGDDSNTSLENMYSKSLTSGESLANRSSSAIGRETTGPSQQDSQKSETNRMSDEEDGTVEEKKRLPSVTVNIALVDPIVFDKDLYQGDKLDLSCKNPPKPEVSDPSNMSEQAIAALIEKVSRENVCSPAKKKRNSYADSPHKFSCPYCSRCFPWLSSLNRHLLTHTGQKPFKCPRCPVTFSTKSNRERHLIRKHNVNMPDAASRATMDRPHKCHLCACSSFSTSSNLARHYRDRHPERSPPPNLIEDAAGSDGESEDISYEEDEEYNYLAEQASLRGLTDRDIMLQNYSQEGDDTHISNNNNNNNNNNKNNNIIIKPDTHKKRNAVFSLDDPENGMRVTQTLEKLNTSVNKGDTNGRNGLTLFSTNKSGASTRPGIDDTVLTDTMKNFLDKSVRQALEDSQRRALEEGSKFVITPAIERHLRSLSAEGDALPRVDDFTSTTEDTKEEVAQCNKDCPTDQMLATHINGDHGVELPYRCHLCDMAFSTRVECLQHMEHAHRVEWADICFRNNIGNIQIFATRLDKMIRKISKRQSGSSLAAKQELSPESDETSEVSQTSKPLKLEIENGESSCATNDKDLPEPEKDDLHRLMGNAKADVMRPNIEHLDDSNSEDGSDESVDEKNDDYGADASVLPEVAKADYLQRKFYCSVCPKRYWSVQDLHTHMRSHTGERPYECSLCERRFSLKNSLTRHLVRHHTDPDDQASKVCMPTGESLPSDEGIHLKNPTENGTKKCDQTCREEEKKIPDLQNKLSEMPDHHKEANKGGDSKENPGTTETDEDMLHDLLGVESSTIDQIFDSQDSAAGLLGV